MTIVDAEGNELPWDGKAFGDLKTRGPWVVQEYMGGDGIGADADGWFHTGDVATVDPNGFIELVDRTKDLIKSGWGMDQLDHVGEYRGIAPRRAGGGGNSRASSEVGRAAAGAGGSAVRPHDRSRRRVGAV